MKKLMFTAAAALCATVGLGDITSANIVGYMNSGFITENENNTIDVGISFSNINNGGKYTVSDKLCETPIVDGDACLIFNPVAYNYDYYMYIADLGEGNSAWYILDGDTGDERYVESFDLKDGDSLVFMPTDPERTDMVTVAGQVADLKGASRVFDCDPDGEPAQVTMPLTNPYPVATTAKMLEGFIKDGDAFLIWNDIAYNYDYYMYIADMGEGKPAWYILDGDTGDERYLENANDVVIPAGRGATFLPAVAGIRTWTVNL